MIPPIFSQDAEGGYTSLTVSCLCAVVPGFVRSIVACCRMAAESPNLRRDAAVDPTYLGKFIMIHKYS